MNPYNHHQPVTSRDRFVGRQNVVEDIKYDLNLAQSTDPQYINIGITGKEGAGKSSLSYIMEEDAKNLGFETIRLQVDKGMVENEVQFFEKLYQSIVSEVGGETESGFLKALGGAVDQVEIDLKFVRAYMNTGSDSDVSGQIIQEDLEILAEKIDASAILIILDNAQHMGANPILLQKLNNIFENIELYILSLVGTDEMFSNIKNAFSPTARMFDKHRLKPFKSYTETAHCILKPLQSVNSPPTISKGTICEVHQLTGGRPYEINLTLFHMYKIWEENESSSLQLSPDVIGRVTGQMEEWRRPVNNELPDKIKNLNQEYLELLRSLLETEPIDNSDLIKYHLLSSISSIDSNSQSQLENKISDLIADLSNKNILQTNSGKVSINGGVYFDTFLKYYLYSQGILSDLDKAHFKRKDDLYPCIHYRLIEKDILSSLSSSHSHFKNISDQGHPFMKQLVSEETLGKNLEESDEKIDIDNPLITDDPSDSLVISQRDYRSEVRECSIGRDSSTDYYSKDERLTITLDIKWLGSKYQITFHSEQPSEIEEIKERLKEKESQLERLNIEVGWKNQFVLIEDAYKELIEKNYEHAQELSQQSIEMSNGDSHSAWAVKAETNMALGEFEQALSDITKSLNILPDNADARLLKSDALINLERIEDAKEEYNRLAKLDPENPDLWAKICHQLCQVEKYAEAREWGERGIEKSGGNNHLKVHLAESEWMHKNYEKAIEYASEVVSEVDEWSETDRVWYLLGICYGKLGDEKTGKNHIYRLASSKRKIFSLGWLEALQGNEDAASSYLSQVNDDPDIQDQIESMDDLDNIDID